MAFAVTAQLMGLEATFAKLKAVDDKVRKQALRKAITKASQLVVKSAKQRVRKRFGILRKSLGYKIRIYRTSGVVLGVIGPRTGFKTAVGTISRGPKKGQTRYENPTHIAHLIERGTKHAPAFPFLRPALDETKDAVVQAVADAVTEVIGS